MTTKCWDIKVEWTDVYWSWLPLKDIKAVDPLELAEYAVSRNI